MTSKFRARYYSCNTTDGWRYFESQDEVTSWLSQEWEKCMSWAIGEVEKLQMQRDGEVSDESVMAELDEWQNAEADATWFCGTIEGLDDDGDWQTIEDNIKSP